MVVILTNINLIFITLAREFRELLSTCKYSRL